MFFRDSNLGLCLGERVLGLLLWELLLHFWLVLFLCKPRILCAMCQLVVFCQQVRWYLTIALLIISGKLLVPGQSSHLSNSFHPSLSYIGKSLCGNPCKFLHSHERYQTFFSAIPGSDQEIKKLSVYFSEFILFNTLYRGSDNI